MSEPVVIGVALGQYRIEAKIGQGGMGVVYRALDTRLNRQVAMKFLSADVADAGALRRFQREAQMASGLNHPHLVTVHGALPDGRTVSVAGTLTLTATREISKITGVDDFDLDLTADGVLLFFRYSDRPGVIGAIGTLLGESGVNIAAMQVARREAGGEALMILTVDSSIDTELLADVAAKIGSSRGSLVDLRAFYYRTSLGRSAQRLLQEALRVDHLHAGDVGSPNNARRCEVGSNTGVELARTRGIRRGEDGRKARIRMSHGRSRDEEQSNKPHGKPSLPSTG